MKCEFCRVNLTGREYYDGKTRLGLWANMCVHCFEIYGIGLGLGRGQHYDVAGKKIELKDEIRMKGWGENEK